jgi:hypothetical protein
MMSGAILISLLAVTASLFLAMRGLQSHGLSFENKAVMAAAWVLVIGVLAFVFTRLGLG